MQVIVHGGAGSSPDEPDSRQAILDDAASEGATAATPLDAVEAALQNRDDVVDELERMGYTRD